ncbi:MAG: carotenoid oxygenase family protein [Myxococcales bacterium]|nr:carotenoid oxygenase family protein [Myxococcales bacterium]
MPTNSPPASATSEPAPRDPYLEGCYAPVQTESPAGGVVLRAAVGAVPRDLTGVFVRNGSNPRFAPRGRYHWFDGDGMLHAVSLAGGVARYRNRYVRTRGFLAEEEAGEALWTGLLVRPDLTRPGGPYKNSGNTDLVWHAGQLLALWWMSGEAYEIELPSLATRGVAEFGAPLPRGLAAHAKVDPRTGELLFIDYGPRAPYLRVGAISRERALLGHAPVELPGPRLQHDIAFTENFALVFDLSMMADPVELRRGRERIKMFRDVPTRIGLVPRTALRDGPRAAPAPVQWFEAAPFYMYHAINAYEDGDAVVLVGCRITDPLVGDPENPARSFTVPAIANLRLEPYLHRWRLDRASGRVTEERLDDVMGEFPRMNDRRLGRPARYCYTPRVAPRETLLFDGFTKHDLARGEHRRYAYPPGWFGGELTFAPRDGAGDRPEDEDDGYLITIASSRASEAAEVFILDARALELVARLPVPARVPVGYHAEWVPGAGRAELAG